MGDAARDLLRHAVATVAYRGGKTVRDAPASFGAFRACPEGRTAAEILAHLGDLYDWALSMAAGKMAWHDSKPMPWEQEVDRFFGTLTKFDEYLASSERVYAPLEGLLQGPVADSLTHIGQLAMMRRLAGSPIKGENYFVAEIRAGRVGAEQAAPKREF